MAENSYVPNHKLMSVLNHFRGLHVPVLNAWHLVSAIFGFQIFHMLPCLHIFLRSLIKNYVTVVWSSLPEFGDIHPRSSSNHF